MYVLTQIEGEKTLEVAEEQITAAVAETTGNSDIEQTEETSTKSEGGNTPPLLSRGHI